MAQRQSSANLLCAGIVLACAATVPSLAQLSGQTPDRAGNTAASPGSPPMRTYAAQQKKRVEVERELKKIRYHHFGAISNVEIRQAGILKLRAYTEAAVFPSLIEIFRDEKDDVRRAVLDHLADQRTDEGDACLAWVAAHDSSSELRRDATSRVASRVKEAEKVSPRIAMVVYGALKSSDESLIAHGAELASGIGMFGAIPWLISAQLGSAPAASGAGDEGNGDLAWIMVGQQVAFVSDLTPVVAESAVAFDPQLSVLTEGVLLRVHSAAVYTYRYEVHNALIDLSERAGGRTRGLGWNQDAWREWYKNEFLPSRKARPVERAADDAGASPK